MTTIAWSLPSGTSSSPSLSARPTSTTSPPTGEVISHIDKGSATSSIAYSQLLPKGSKVVETRGDFDLDVENSPALPREEYEPPMQAFAYRVRFYYTSMRSPQEFWNSYGKSWSHDIDKFASPSPAINDAAKELTSGATTQDEKLDEALRRRDEAGQHPLLPRALER